MSNSTQIRVDDLVSQHDTCTMLGITRSTLWTWVNNGLLSKHNILGNGHYNFFLRAEVEELQHHRIICQPHRAKD